MLSTISMSCNVLELEYKNLKSFKRGAPDCNESI